MQQAALQGATDKAKTMPQLIPDDMGYDEVHKLALTMEGIDIDGWVDEFETEQTMAKVVRGGEGAGGTSSVCFRTTL